MNYKALIVDFGGVVTTRFRSALSSFCEREGLDPDRLHYVLREDPIGKAALFEAEAGNITQRAFERQLGKLLGVSDIDLTRRICADLRPCESMLALIARAKGSGFKTAMLSNSWGTGGYDIYTGYDLPRYFDVVVVSDRVGHAKPDAEIYKYVLVQLGLKANQCIFADDVPRNLEPASSLGMTTVLVDEPSDAVREITRLLGLATPKPR